METDPVLLQRHRSYRSSMEIERQREWPMAQAMDRKHESVENIRCTDRDLGQAESLEPSQLPTIADEDSTTKIPEGGYGWVCVAACFGISACTWGITVSYGVFLANYLANNTYPGATPLQYAFIGGLSISMSSIVGPLVTLGQRLTSTRTVMFIGIFILSTAFVTASFSTKIWHLILTQGVLYGAGVGLVYSGCAGIVSQWFQKRRSLANSITSSGVGIGGLIFSLSVRAVINRYGVPWAFRMLAICVFVICSICAMLLRDRNIHVKPNQVAFDLKLLRRYEVCLLLLWAFFSELAYVSMLFSLSDFATFRGLSVNQGALLNAISCVGMSFGRPLIGFTSDAMGRMNVALFATFCCSFACFVIWIPSTTIGPTMLFAILAGMVGGTFWVVVSPLSVEVVGLKDLPSCLSLIWLSVAVPTTFSEPIALMLRRPGRSNPYLYPQLFSGFCFLGASTCSALLRVWKIGSEDKKKEERSRRGGEEAVEGEMGFEDWAQEVERRTGWKGLLDQWKRGSKWWRYTAI